MTAPLFATRDQSLLDELLRLAAAAGITPDVARDGAAVLRGWSAAPLVLVGADLADEVARLHPARRPGVHLVAWGGVPDELFRAAVALGAEDVAELPRSDGWLIETAHRPRRPAPRPGHGARRGRRLRRRRRDDVRLRAGPGGLPGAGPAVVVDADPLGPGLDRVLGLEGSPGARWDALCQTTGRLSSRGRCARRCRAAGRSAC